MAGSGQPGGRRGGGAAGAGGGGVGRTGDRGGGGGNGEFGGVAGGGGGGGGGGPEPLGGGGGGRDDERGGERGAVPFVGAAAGGGDAAHGHRLRPVAHFRHREHFGGGGRSFGGPAGVSGGRGRRLGGVGAEVFRERGQHGAVGGDGADGGEDVPPVAVGPLRGGFVADVAPVRAVSGDGGDGGAAVCGGGFGDDGGQRPVHRGWFQHRPPCVVGGRFTGRAGVHRPPPGGVPFGGESPHRLAPVRPGGAPLLGSRSTGRRGGRRMAGGSGRGSAGHDPGGIPGATGPAVIKNLINRRQRRRECYDKEPSSEANNGIYANYL